LYEDLLTEDVEVPCELTRRFRGPMQSLLRQFVDLEDWDSAESAIRILRRMHEHLTNYMTEYQAMITAATSPERRRLLRRQDTKIAQGLRDCRRKIDECNREIRWDGIDSASGF